MSKFEKRLEEFKALGLFEVDDEWYRQNAEHFNMSVTLPEKYMETYNATAFPYVVEIPQRIYDQKYMPFSVKFIETCDDDKWDETMRMYALYKQIMDEDTVAR